MGGVLRFDIPGFGVAGVGDSPPVRDALVPVRRQEGGINTGVAIHNRGTAALTVQCRLMQAGAVLEEADIPLAANGQDARFIDQVFPTADTLDFVGSGAVPDARAGTLLGGGFGTGWDKPDFHHPSRGPGAGDPGARAGTGARAPGLHPLRQWRGHRLRSGAGESGRRCRPSPPIYFYDQQGDPISAESLVDITEELEVGADGALSPRTAMNPLGELTIATHGRGGQVSGSVAVAAAGPIGGVLRFDIPALGVAGVGDSPPVRDALVPVRRQDGGINTGVALHNRGEAPLLVRCRLMRDGAVLEETMIPLAANGQDSRFIDEVFPTADTSEFVGSVRCLTPEPGRFSAVALELDGINRIFTTLPVVPVVEVP